jgi:Cu/Ag efflux pump CusA
VSPAEDFFRPVFCWLKEASMPASKSDSKSASADRKYRPETRLVHAGTLRSLQDWFIRYQLNSVSGVAEVASIGGFVRQYQIDVDPNKLRVYDLPLGTVYSAIANSNKSVGGKVLTQGNTEYLIRGVGWLQGVDDLENVVITSRNGVPVQLIAYHTAVFMGTDVDQPRNLAKSVTVE